MVYWSYMDPLETKPAASRMPKSTFYSFGATSAIITNLAIITGLDAVANAKFSILSSLLVIAVADNISDALGIHIHQESEILRTKDVWLSTLTNFSARLAISLVFILLVLLLPLRTAVLCSIVYGFFVLAYVSIVIAREKLSSPSLLIAEHVGIPIAVIAASHFLGNWLARIF
jgi:vacuolar iron transporter family protein